MGAWEFPLNPDLQEAVESGLLTVAEAWRVMDDRLMNPEAAYPRELLPLLRRLRMLEWEPSEMTRQ